MADGRKSISEWKSRIRLQGGQAVVELAVCIVALIIVLLGYFLVSAVTLENVKNTMIARTKADENSRKGLNSSSGAAENILRWDYGNHDLPFTYDDKPSKGYSSDGSPFYPEIPTQEVLDKVPDSFNVIDSLSMTNLFLNAADLSEGTSKVNDPLEKRGLESLRHSFKNVFGVDSFQLKDSVFIPAAVSVPLPENNTGQ